MKKQTTLRLPYELDKKLHEEANKRYTSKHNLIIQALLEKYDNEEVSENGSKYN